MGVLKVWDAALGDWVEVGGMMPTGLGGKFIDIQPNSYTLSASDIALIDQPLTGIDLRDTIWLDAWMLLVNNSGADRVYTISVRIGPTTFDLPFVTPTIAASATNRWGIHVEGVANSKSEVASATIVQVSMQPVGSADQDGATLSSTGIVSALRWAANAISLVGVGAVNLEGRSNNGAAGQTLELVSGLIRVSHAPGVSP